MSQPNQNTQIGTLFTISLWDLILTAQLRNKLVILVPVQKATPTLLLRIFKLRLHSI